MLTTEPLQRTSGSEIEEKKSAMTWHYRKCVPVCLCQSLQRD